MLKPAQIPPTSANIKDDAAIDSLLGYTPGGGPDYISATLYGDQYDAYKGFLSSSEDGGLNTRKSGALYALTGFEQSSSH